jgi:hypothetical protein
LIKGYGRNMWLSIVTAEFWYSGMKVTCIITSHMWLHSTSVVALWSGVWACRAWVHKSRMLGSAGD